MQRHQIQKGQQGHAQIKNIIAIASGKGGVGKSTVTANLAIALKQQGVAVGILDADIYGPSQGMMMGLEGAPNSLDGKTMEPFNAHGVQVNTMSALVDQDQPMVWRGPMVSRALTQLMEETNWNELDILLVDMPPGTGDIQLTLSQKIPVAGAVIVTTPQDIALLDAKRGISMFEKVGIPTLGIVENMSTHTCSNCGHQEAIFGDQGGHQLADDMHVPLLAQLPLALEIRQQGDQGVPICQVDPEGDIALGYQQTAKAVVNTLEQLPRDYSVSFGEIQIE